MPAGRPPIFDSPEDLQNKIDEYFQSLEGESHFEADTEDESKDNLVWDVPPTSPSITGLCLFLGFESRQSFHDYGKSPEYSYTIKRARLMIEHKYELSGQYAKNPAFQVLALKNLGWSDKQEVDMRAKVAASDEDTIFE